MIREAWKQALSVTVGNIAAVQQRGHATRRAERHLGDTLAAFTDRFPDPDPPDDDPLFLLSAGWRSGSTFLQRLCMSSGDRFLWGEPYDHSAIVQTMAEQLRPFVAKWPDEEFLADAPSHEELMTSFIATLYPKAADLRAAHRAYFERLFAAPARQQGYARWGLKEVRLTSEHAAYLRWLYPNARFVFLVRHPYDAWKSYRPWRRWFWRWPDGHVATPTAFGRHWAEQASDFVDEKHRVDGLLLRYEDIGTDWERLAPHLGHAVVTPDELPRVGGAFAAADSIPAPERWLLRAEVRATAARLGYECP